MKFENTVSLTFHASENASMLHAVTNPAGIRFAVSGNVLSLKEPRSTWGKYFASSLPVGNFLLHSSCY
jgi:hypothetical protein